LRRRPWRRRRSEDYGAALQLGIAARQRYGFDVAQDRRCPAFPAGGHRCVDDRKLSSKAWLRQRDASALGRLATRTFPKESGCRHRKIFFCLVVILTLSPAARGVLGSEFFPATKFRIAPWLATSRALAKAELAALAFALDVSVNEHSSRHHRARIRSIVPHETGLSDPAGAMDRARRVKKTSCYCAVGGQVARLLLLLPWTPEQISRRTRQYFIFCKDGSARPGGQLNAARARSELSTWES